MTDDRAAEPPQARDAAVSGSPRGGVDRLMAGPELLEEPPSPAPAPLAPPPPRPRARLELEQRPLGGSAGTVLIIYMLICL